MLFIYFYLLTFILFFSFIAFIHSGIFNTRHLVVTENSFHGNGTFMFTENQFFHFIHFSYFDLFLILFIADSNQGSSCHSCHRKFISWKRHFSSCQNQTKIGFHSNFIHFMHHQPFHSFIHQSFISFIHCIICAHFMFLMPGVPWTENREFLHEFTCQTIRGILQCQSRIFFENSCCRWKWDRKVKIGPKIGFFGNFSKTLHQIFLIFGPPGTGRVHSNSVCPSVRPYVRYVR